MKKSICQSRNVISCYANEIEMKGFNAKMKKKNKKGKAKQGLIQDENKTKFGLVKGDHFSFGQKGS